MLAGVIGTALVVAPRIGGFQGLEADRNTISDPVQDMAVVVLSLLAANLLYMALREETEPLYLVLSPPLIPLLLICVLPGYYRIFFGG